MKEIIMKNKVFCAILLIMIIGVIVIAVAKFNFSLMYETHQRVDVAIGTDFSKSEVEAIVKEVYGNEKTIVQAENFNDSISVNVAQTTDTQVAALKEKIDAKYGLDVTLKSTNVTTVPHTRLRDVVSPYVVPTIIVSLIMVVYIGIKNFKNKPLAKVLLFCTSLLISVVLFFGLLAITRLPICDLTMPVGFVLYVAIVIGLLRYLSKK